MPQNRIYGKIRVLPTKKFVEAFSVKNTRRGKIGRKENSPGSDCALPRMPVTKKENYP